MLHLKYPVRPFIFWIHVFGLCMTNGTSYSAPSQNFLIMDVNDEFVTHIPSGLMWQRCAEGQRWKNNTCTGQANVYSFEEAANIRRTINQQTDWRLPTISELTTLVKWEGNDAGINEGLFPNTPQSSYFWSATSSTLNPTIQAWVIGFSKGFPSDGFKYKTEQLHVRLVRGVSKLNAQGENTPTEDFIDQGNGVVTHKSTGLMWQRCSVGQVWNGKTCQGSPTYFSAASRSRYAGSIYEWNPLTYISGYDYWRLPTIDELKSLVEYKNVSPAINTSLFPNTPSMSYWPSGSGGGYATKVIDFNFGNISSAQNVGFDGSLIIESGGDKLPLRLVRLVNQPDNAHYDPNTQTATLLDVLVDGEHYQISLRSRGNNLFSLSEVNRLTEQQHEQPALYSPASEDLIIQKIQVGTKFYSANLKNTGAYVFKLDSLKEITQLSVQ